jgi:hypothetical protein
MATSSQHLRVNPANSAPQSARGTQTQTQTQGQAAQQLPNSQLTLQPVLRLRGAHDSRQRVRWSESVVDNEGLGRKSSKGGRNSTQAPTLTQAVTDFDVQFAVSTTGLGL